MKGSQSGETARKMESETMLYIITIKTMTRWREWSGRSRGEPDSILTASRYDAAFCLL